LKNDSQEDLKNEKQQPPDARKWGLYNVPRVRLEEMAAVSARAFTAKNDLIGNYMFELEPDNEALQMDFFRSLVTSAPENSIMMGTSPELEAVSIWFPPGNQDESGGHSESKEAYGTCLKETRSRVAAVLEAIETLIIECAPARHWYLHLVAVDPKHMNQGLSSRLILPMLQFSDEQKLPATLVTQHEGNIALYEHLGFKVIKSRNVVSTKLNFWFMQHQFNKTN
jgi:ribosomal protein S18 acetylase RimI-like enzyme